MGNIKAELKKAINEHADDETLDCFEKLTEADAVKLKKDIEKSFDMIEGIMPIITIKELRRNEDVIRWKLLCETEIHSMTRL